MPTSGRTWPTKTLSFLVPLVGIDLIIQYFAGLGTNAYAPASGFTMNTDFGIYDLHWTNGYVLGILSIALVIIAVFSRQGRNVVPAVVSLAAVLVAAFAGMAFVNTTPNPPWATITMGLAFLVAFSTVIAMMFRLNMARRWPGSPVSPASSPA